MDKKKTSENNKFFAGVGSDGRIHIGEPGLSKAAVDACNALVTQLLEKDSERHADDLTEAFKIYSQLSSHSPTNLLGSFYVRMIFESWCAKSINPFAVAYRLGRVNERAWHTLVAVTKATNGRRLIGATSRAKVALSAESFRHLSRSNASYEMADIVNLDPGTIKRYLSELFPGDKWKQ